MKPVWMLALALAIGLTACGGGDRPKGKGDSRAEREAPPEPPSPFADWSAVIVGGDDRASGGERTPIFDNARRDVARAFVRAGFDRDNMAELSVNPGDDRDVDETDPDTFVDRSREVTRNSEGCLFYFTSHGSRQGITFGRNNGLDPRTLRRMLNDWCEDRPTVVIVSACYSGVFVPALRGPNRMVMTAARDDRSSFGCGGNDRYPYFDDCVLSSMPRVRTFIDLADRVKRCVADKEDETNSSPPSQPQVAIGNDIRETLEDARFQTRSRADRNNDDEERDERASRRRDRNEDDEHRNDRGRSRRNQNEDESGYDKRF